MPPMLVRGPSLVALLAAAALAVAAPASAESFTDPLGDNVGLDTDGHTLTAPDMTYASHQLLADGRIELAMSFGPGLCRRVISPGNTEEFAPRAVFALYTDSTAIGIPDYRIVKDGTSGAYVVRPNTSTLDNIAQIEAIDASGILTVRFNPQYIRKPQQLRWMGGQTCKGDLPYQDVELVPNQILGAATNYLTLNLPFPPPADPADDPPTQSTTDPIPDALPTTTSAAQPRLTKAAASLATTLRRGLPNAGVRLTISGLPAGDVLAVLGTTKILARGSATTRGGKAVLRLKPTAAGRRAFHGAGTIGTRLKLVFSPRGGGRQTTVTRRVTMKRLR